jgi:hypothetical protein
MLNRFLILAMIGAGIASRADCGQNLISFPVHLADALAPHWTYSASEKLSKCNVGV